MLPATKLPATIRKVDYFMSFTVLTAEFCHETNSFNIHKTGLKHFEARLLLKGDEAIAARANANTELAGFLDVAHESDWVVHHAVSAAAAPAGPVTRKAFDTICEMILDVARKTNLNGILLGLHGAMVLEDHPDGEGLLLEKLRAVVGLHMPIAVTLDPHANVTEKMCALAQIVVSFNTYPHVDMRDTGQLAARLLHRTMRGEITPRTLRVTVPMLEEANSGRTDIGPMIERMALARAHEQTDGALAVSINAGFGTADVPEIGPTVLVTYHGDQTPHLAFAQTIADDIWDKRHGVLNSFLSADAATAQARIYDAVKNKGPLVIADYADNPGAGAYGDAPGLLKSLLGQNITGACFGPMVDAEAAAFLHQHKVGDHVSLALGGKIDPHFGGGPLKITGKIMDLSDGHYIGDGPMMGGLAGTYGTTAVLRIAGIDVLVVTNPNQMLDLQQFRAFGIEPTDYRVIALKSQQHFRAAFEPMAGKVIVCDSGALCSPDVRNLPFKHVPRPIFPLV
jgi:microcystin degradation protein MlrC